MTMTHVQILEGMLLPYVGFVGLSDLAINYIKYRDIDFRQIIVWHWQATSEPYSSLNVEGGSSCFLGLPCIKDKINQLKNEFNLQHRFTD